jgi:hypothetical protein
MCLGTPAEFVAIGLYPTLDFRAFRGTSLFVREFGARRQLVDRGANLVDAGWLSESHGRHLSGCTRWVPGSAVPNTR